MYSLILQSRKPEARAFKKWVTSDVLPSIRKYGYITSETERATGEEAVIRKDFAAADTEALTAAKDYTDTRETAIRSDMTSGDAKTLADAKKHAESKIAELVNSAPATLDTLNELAEALGNDPNFASTVAEQIGGKVDNNRIYSIKSWTTQKKRT